MESEAIRLILELCGQGTHQWITSDAVEFELARNPDEEHRTWVLELIKFADDRLAVTESALSLARAYESHGIGTMDAIHLAIAESGACEILLTTDDDFIRRARGLSPPPRVRIENPSRWILEEVEHGA